MARPTRAAAALAGKQANNRKTQEPETTSPYFDRVKSNGRGKAKQPAVRAKKPSAKKDQYPTSDDFESEESDTSSSEDSDDARDVYKEPDSDAIDEDDDEDEDDAGSDFEAEEDAASVISEDIDEDVLDFSVKKKGEKTPTTTNGGSGGGKTTKNKRKANNKESTSSSPSKKAKKVADSDFEGSAAGEDDDDEDVSEEELQDGRKVTRVKLVKAPSHHVKPGLVDPHTMEFLSDLRSHNDREWFAKNGGNSHSETFIANTDQVGCCRLI